MQNTDLCQFNRPAPRTEDDVYPPLAGSAVALVWALAAVAIAVCTGATLCVLAFLGAL